jgi:hypothetical protein
MGGLAKICRMYGGMEVEVDGRNAEWVWDYVNEKPRLKSEMTKDELKASEKARFEIIKKQMK